MNYLSKYKSHRNEEGLVSIIVVTIVIIILSLMTIGFAKIMDREFRQSLDRELAVQANYAAESGMNDARNYIASGVDVDTAGNCLNTDSLSAAQQPACPTAKYWINILA
jgi:Tfp pilus assembly protein PilX